MVKDVLNEVERIFSKQDNFDVSGFAKAELVTPKLAEALAHLTPADLHRFGKRGYEFYWFKEDFSDGIISKWYHKPGKIHIQYSLRLYFNQTYPKEAAKGADKDGKLGTGDNQGT